MVVCASMQSSISLGVPFISYYFIFYIFLCIHSNFYLCFYLCLCPVSLKINDNVGYLKNIPDH